MLRKTRAAKSAKKIFLIACCFVCGGVCGGDGRRARDPKKERMTDARDWSEIERRLTRD
jgi:hypothetical protein